jgi:hypothetical protein
MAFAALFLCLGMALHSQGASLGVALGAAFPGPATANVPSDRAASFNWGFYVNIPLLRTFALCPSSELYKFGSANATDFDLAFKFIVPLGGMGIFAGISPGLTAVNDFIAPHVGLVGGATFGLVSNLEAFVQAKYNYLFDSGQDTSVFHVNCGVLFNF